ncbi:LLM class flavin-dependent oxidoreductase [Streptomyces sp. URMC 123]|uniref:LLM class flavin-dependent oxidoreductase n=1 Tax=Streptomyces sp. URMC 123 TaxID=3423403 RepID=UPI003F1D77B9
MRVGAFLLAAQFPGQGHGEALHRAVRSAETAEEAGLDAVWVAEHHFVPYGVCPSAVTLAALLLGRTRRIGVGTAAYESGFPESLDLLVRWLREPSVGAAGERFRFRTVPVVPRAAEAPGDAGPPVVVACTSPATVRLAAERGLPMLLGMHSDDEEKAAMVALWREHSRAAGHRADGADHVAAGVAQIADDRRSAEETLLKAMPGWLRRGLEAHVTVDGRPRAMRDPLAYTQLLCGLHPVGPPRLCADRLAATAERTGITRFALLVEGSGELSTTEENIQRLGREVLPLLG